MPKMHEPVKRSVPFPLRVRDHEAPLVDLAAERLHVTRSEFMRDAILARARTVLGVGSEAVADASL
jgi:uncharacterized protein (DUF1778 family)